MAGLVVLALFITTSLSVIEAKASKSKLSARRDGPVDAESEEPCLPGQFYRGPGCGKCFCTADQKKVCSPPGTCQMDDKVPTTKDLIRIVNQVQLHLLPSRPNTGAECYPGVSYRVDCNRCLCAQTKSLVCESLLCPSYDEDNKRQAKKMSGKPCQEGEKITKECIECSCDDGKYACEAKDDCISSVALLKLQRGTKDRQECAPGTYRFYPNPNGGRPCICTTYGKLRCPLDKKLSKPGKPRSKLRPRVTLKGKMRVTRPRGNVKEMPFDMALSDPNSGKMCMPGVVYRKECNKCFCTKKRQLRCTVKVCPSAKDQEIFKKMRLRLEKQNE